MPPYHAGPAAAAARGGASGAATSVGVVALEGRGELPFVTLHREALFLHAVRALHDVPLLQGRVLVTTARGQQSRVRDALEEHELAAEVVDGEAWWSSSTGPPLTVLVHDPLCPLVPAAFLSRCLAAALTDRQAVVAFRPVTDTIKTVVDGQIVGTLDRDRFAIVTSPVVLARGPGDPAPPTEDFAALVAWVRSRGPLELAKAPSLGRRVDDSSAVNLLECMDEMARAVQET
jgi:hypothetical protein